MKHFKLSNTMQLSVLCVVIPCPLSSSFSYSALVPSTLGEKKREPFNLEVNFIIFERIIYILNISLSKKSYHLFCIKFLTLSWTPLKIFNFYC